MYIHLLARHLDHSMVSQSVSQFVMTHDLLMDQKKIKIINYACNPTKRPFYSFSCLETV